MKRLLTISDRLEAVLIPVLIRKLLVARHLYREARLSGKQIISE